MRMATSPHHTNPRSATLDFWRKTSSIDDYKLIQAKRRLQTNRPTSSNQQKLGFFNFENKQIFSVMITSAENKSR